MIPAYDVDGKTVLVLGFGRSGVSAAQSLKAGAARVLCWDDGADRREQAQEQGFEVYDAAQKGMAGIDLVIVSPGIAHHFPAPHPVLKLAYAAGVPVDNDIGLFFKSYATQDWGRFERSPMVIAVTGSNGKSTTAALIHHLAQQAGFTAHLAGNIGRGVLDLDPIDDGDVIVLELSSYQTELARHLTPDIAIFTNLSPDHLDRHAGFGGYFAAKRRLFAEGGPERAIIGVDELEGQILANQLAETTSDDRIIRISSGQKLADMGWVVTARKGFLAENKKGRQVASIDLRGCMGLPGAHNHQNACAAYAALRSMYVAPRKIEEGLKSFQSLPHRSQQVRELDGVTYVNDSKATNVDSAIKALQSFTNIRWICGGVQKEGGVKGIEDHLGNVIKAYVIGEAAQDFAGQLDVPLTISTTMQEAIKQARADAQAGDVILLAPCAGSFDQYNNFEERGDDFVNLVQGLT